MDDLQDEGADSIESLQPRSETSKNATFIFSLPSASERTRLKDRWRSDDVSSNATL